MGSPQPNDTEQAHAPIKRLSDPVKPTDAVEAKPAAADAAATRRTMIRLPDGPEPQADDAKK